MKLEWMISEVSNYLYGYLKDGVVQIDSVIHHADFTIDRLQDLLKLRFIKSNRTIAFMESLEKELASIKSSTDSSTLESYYEVRGEILWEETLHRRLQTNPKDHYRFITKETERTFNTDENLVLKELLSKLHVYCYDDQFLNLFALRPWYKDVMKNRSNVEDALYHNIYISKIDKRKISDRIINKTKSHRKKIYREAAYLLYFIRKLEQGDFTSDHLKDVLHEFFILPANEEVLFELYWIVQVLKKQNNAVFYLMDGSNSKVASWAVGEYDFHLYHDSAGSNHVRFAVHSDELAESLNPYLVHESQSFYKYNQLAQTFFNQEKSLNYWRGRPDILIEKVHRQSKQIAGLTIGEIKNTQSINYASKGLSELVSYMHLVKNKDGEYLIDSDVTIKGLLCLGEIEVDGVERENVKVVSLYNKEVII